MQFHQVFTLSAQKILRNTEDNMADYTNIDDPSAYFQTVLHSSANAATITNDGNSDLQPDLIWSKARGAAYTHGLYDSNRGVTKFVGVNQSAETTASSGFDLTSFNTDGFSTGNNQYNTICGGTTYVAWQWKANGGTTTSVSASGTGNGCINACTHQANTTAGFSIITYTGRDDQLNNAHESKVTHGLGVAPSVFICKRRDGTSNWYYLGGEQSSVNNGWNNVHLLLNQTATINGNNYTSNTEPDSTYIYLGNQLVNTVDSWVGYAFAEKQGYSKFSSYVGNGDANGRMIATGFKPAFVLLKRTDVTNNWLIYDNKRSGYNPKQDKLYPDDTSAEDASTASVDLLSNGFKLRASSASQNASGGHYIYMAFAENPFVTSTGVPTTAR